MAISGLQRAAYFPDAATHITAMATAAGAAQAAAYQFATLGGIAVAIVVAVFGWLVDIQYGMASTLLLFEQRRLVVLRRRLLAALITICGVAVVTWLVIWATVAAAATISPRPVTTPTQVHWSVVGGQAARALVVAVIYLGIAMTIAFTTRAITPTVAVMGSLWVVTLPLAKVDTLRNWLPHSWIADWMALPDESQFAAYVWPRADGPAAPAGWFVLAAAVCAIGAAAWTFSSMSLDQSSE